MGSGNLMAQDKWTAWPHVTSSRFLAMQASQIPGDELETSCSNLSIDFVVGARIIERTREMKRKNVSGCLKCFGTDSDCGPCPCRKIQLPRCVWFTRVGLFIPAAVRIAYAAEAVVVASVAHDHVDLADPVIRRGVNRLVLLSKY